DRVVVPQRAARRPREARDLLDGPVGRAPARRARGGHGRVSFPVFASRVRRRGPRQKLTLRQGQPVSLGAAWRSGRPCGAGRTVEEEDPVGRATSTEAAMATTEQVRRHYAGRDLAARILAAAGAGAGPVDVDALTPYDQLHAGGAPATTALLDLLGLTAGIVLLDVGCGLGGPARLAARRHGCHVTGVDVSPDFVDAARELTDRTGLTDLVTVELGDGE